jgi:hypothetical protein
LEAVELAYGTKIEQQGVQFLIDIAKDSSQDPWLRDDAVHMLHKWHKTESLLKLITDSDLGDKTDKNLQAAIVKILKESHIVYALKKLWNDESVPFKIRLEIAGSLFELGIRLRSVPPILSGWIANTELEDDYRNEAINLLIKYNEADRAINLCREFPSVEPKNLARLLLVRNRESDLLDYLMHLIKDKRDPGAAETLEILGYTDQAKKAWFLLALGDTRNEH